MEKILKTLQSLFINGEFWLSEEGDVIYSNVCTLYPDCMFTVANLGLAVDTYMANLCDCPRLRFFKVV